MTVFPQGRSTDVVIRAQLTPTERRIFELLSDGRPHRKQELFACMDDELAEWTAVKRRLTCLRKKIRDDGLEIICQVIDYHYAFRLMAVVTHRVTVE